MRLFAQFAAMLALGLAVTSAAAELPWRSSFKAAQTEAAKSKKLIMIDFYAVWCGPCKQMKATTLADKTVIKGAAGIIPIRLDAEKEGAALAAQYGVYSYPTFLFVDAKGEVFGRASGGYPVQPFLKLIYRAQSVYRDYAPAKAKVKASPKDGSAQAKLAFLEASRGRLDEAERAARTASGQVKANRDLAQAWVMIGDGYMQQKSFNAALNAFLKAGVSAVDGKEKAMSLLGQAVAHGQMGKMSEAKRLLQQISKMKDAPAAYRLQADSMLSRMP